jgi:hypothetical protein
VFERACEVDQPLAERYPGSRYNLACDLALLIPVSPADQREHLARRALEELRLACASGYANFANIKADDDLDPLRDRDDFKLFVLDIEMPANPFAQSP